MTQSIQADRVPPNPRVNYIVGLLFVAYLLNFLDRQIINILAEPIKNELHLADWQLGVMTGLAFALFYTVLGIPLARFADRPTTHRPRLIAGALALWSGMTALCGLATNFWQLFAARIGVGIGESGCSPAAHSLIADLVPPERRGRAMGIYSLGIPLGKLIGMALGGVVAQLYGWRVAFFVVGLPGLVVAVIAWTTMPEPRRMVAEHARKVEAASSSIMAAVRQLGPIGSFWWVSIAGGFMSFLAYGQTAFMGSFFIRVHGMTVGEAGVTLGLAFGATGALGTWAGSQIADRLAARDGRAMVLVPMAAAVVGGMLFVASVMMPTATGALLVLAGAAALNAAWYGPIFAVVQGIVPRQQRATAAAIHLFILGLIGLGLGPVGFGVLSDLLNAGGAVGPFTLPPLGQADGLRYALAFASAPATIVSVFAFWMASRRVRQHLAQNAS